MAGIFCFFFEFSVFILFYFISFFNLDSDLGSAVLVWIVRSLFYWINLFSFCLYLFVNVMI